MATRPSTGPRKSLVWLPVAAAGFSLAVAEIGLALLPDDSLSGGEVPPATAWLVQSFITGCLAILLTTAWRSSLARLRWPASIDCRTTLALTAAWACFGWIAWMALRVSSRGGDGMVAPMLVFTVPMLALTVPLLWHAVVTLARPLPAAWVIAGFIGLALALQIWGAPRIAAEVIHIFIINSALIVAAVGIWLAIISLPPVNLPASRTA